MKYSTILRVEKLRTHLGPYRNYRYMHRDLKVMIDRHESCLLHPSLPEDPLLSAKQLRPSPFWPSHLNRRFGFSSWEQLFKWFTVPELKLLERHGFRVWIFKVESHRVFHGDHQTIFDCTGVSHRESATRRLHAMPQWKTS